jgi:hypothetical protein
LHIVGNGSEIAVFDINADVDRTHEVLMLDDIWRRFDGNVGQIGELHDLAARSINRQFTNRGQAIASFWRAPDVDVVRPVRNVNVADFFAQYES